MTFAFLLNFGDLLVRKWDKCTSDSGLICWVVDGNLESFIVCIIDLKSSEAVRKINLSFIRGTNDDDAKTMANFKRDFLAAIKIFSFQV